MSALLLGTGKAILTPPLGTPLAGYGANRPASEVLDDLELRAFWFQETAEAEARAVCLVTADILGFTESLTTAIRAELAERFDLAPDAVLLAASHTHSGPQTCENMSKAGGPPDPETLRTLRQRLVTAVGEARGALRPITLHVGHGHLEGYAINRRVLVNGQAVMAPNPNGVRDDAALAISCRDAEGRVAAVLFHYTCHPTTMGDTRITGDYPGAARRHVERAFEGACAGFLPGCFGDIRPACTLIGGKRFRRGLPDDVAVFGEALGAEVVRAVQKGGPPLSPSLLARTDTLSLPLAKEPERANLTLQRLDLAETLRLVALGGEICVDYGHFVKGLDAEGVTVPVGYTNGMVGYICPARLFLEGGYEPDTSHSVFDLPSPFQPAIEEIIHEGIRRLME